MQTPEPSTALTGRITRWLDRLDRLVSHATAILCIVLLAALFVQVVNRYVLGISWRFLQFLIPFCFAWLSLLGTALAVRRRAHFSVDLLPNALAGGIGRTAGVLLALMTLAGCLLMVWAGDVFFAHGLTKEDPATGISAVWIYASMLVGALVMTVFAAEALALTVTGRPLPRAGGADGDPPAPRVPEAGR